MPEFSQEYFAGLQESFNRQFPPNFYDRSGPDHISYISPDEFTTMFPNGTRSGNVNLAGIFEHMGVQVDADSVRQTGPAYFQSAPNRAKPEHVFPTQLVIGGIAKAALVGITPPAPRPSNGFLRFANWALGRRNRARLAVSYGTTDSRQ